MNVFTAWSMLSVQTFVPSTISSFCRTYTEAPIYLYIWGSSSNGNSPLVWWYFSRFSSIVTFSSVILSVIYIVLPSVFCWVTRVVPGFLNLPSMYLILMHGVLYSSLVWILRTCVDDGTFPASSSALERLVRYSILRASTWIFANFFLEYTDRSPVIFYVSLMLYFDK